MSQTSPVTPDQIPPIHHDYLGAVLSYLLPGLGQLSQGRIVKGLVFFISLHALFFYGMALGHWKNVYIPNASPEIKGFNRVVRDIYSRVHFAGQVGIGVSAWPAIYQYIHVDDKNVERLGGFQKEPSSEVINTIQREDSKAWDLGLVYTVIAGVLNLLVIFDAFAGPAIREVTVKKIGGEVVKTAPPPPPAVPPATIPAVPEPKPEEPAR